MKKQYPELKQLNPRMRGIYEQYNRALRLLQLARRCKKPTFRFRNLIAAVYPARAIVELMFESADKQEIRDSHSTNGHMSRDNLKMILSPKIPYFLLLEKIRIHDFHRFGCLPPDAKVHSVFYGGPLKLVAKQGTAAMIITPKGPKSILTGDSSIKNQRPLCNENGRFFDEESEKYISLDEMLEAYLDAIPQVITEFEALRAG